MAVAPRKPRKVNYLNNRDMLAEIHKSKTSFSSYVDDEYHQYDLIIGNAEDPLEKSSYEILNPEIIEQAKAAKAARIAYNTGEKLDPLSISTEELIFRVMTWDHIPLCPKPVKKTLAKKSAKDLFIFGDDETDESIITENEEELVHEKVNFPPYQHFKIIDNKPVCVGKSHWTGGMDNGYFSVDHGRTTNKLGRMYMMLCEKYSMKYNWRGYTYREEMVASAILQLTYVGLRFNEARSNNPFAFFTATVNHVFVKILNDEKRNQNIRDDLLETQGFKPSMTRQLKEFE